MLKKIFKKKKKPSKGSILFGKIDKLITGLIIGGAVGGMIYNKRKTLKERTSIIKDNLKSVGKKGYKKFGELLVGILKIFNKK